MIMTTMTYLSPIGWFAFDMGYDVATADHQWDNVISEGCRNVYRKKTAMSLGRGNFILSCDHPDCDTEVDLETQDFNVAKQCSQEYKSDNDWTTVRRGGTYMDLCGDHG